jgi:hypothetical protein
MKAIWAAVGTVWFTGWTICSYQAFASARPHTTVIESATPLPPSGLSPSARSAVRTPIRTFAPEALLGGVPTPKRARSTSFATPFSPPATTRFLENRSIAPPARRSTATRPIVKTSVIPETPDAAPEATGEPRCLLCGEPAYSWVERDGKRYGYCLKHQNQASGGMKRSKTSGETRPQCLAITKAGTRCRRRAGDDSGYCYQHKPH